MQIDLSSRGLQAFSPGELSSQSGAGAEAALLHVVGLNLSRNSLGSVQGLQGFTQLTVLDLSFNGLTSLDGGLPLGLTSLNISHNNIASLQGGALCPLLRLEELNIAWNRLADLRGVSSGGGNSVLRLLDASGNRLHSLNGIECCTGLEELHVDCNLLKETTSVAPIRLLPRLRSLLMKDNPILLRKRQMQALFALLPPAVQFTDVPAPSSAPSVNTSTVSASTAATAVEIEELRRASANSSRETAHHNQRLPLKQQRDVSNGTHNGSRSLLRQGEPLPPPPVTSSSTTFAADSHSQMTPHHGRSVGSPERGGRRSGEQRSQRRPNGTSPLNGVGGEEVSPTCPRKSLPNAPPPVPPLQPYNVAPSGATALGKREQQLATAAANPLEAHMLRSSLLERVVGVEAPHSVPAALSATPARSQNSRNHNSLPYPAATSHRTVQAQDSLLEERDAYKRQMEELTEEVDRLQRALLLERENTAVVLCINEQLQKRLEEFMLTGTSASTIAQLPAPLPPHVPLPLAPRFPGPTTTLESSSSNIQTVEIDSHDDFPTPKKETTVSATVCVTGGGGSSAGAALLSRRSTAAALMAKLRPTTTTVSEVEENGIAK